jgi:hypothetical protein
MDLAQFLQWFVTAFLGAAIVKLLDLAVARFLKRQSRKDEDISKLSLFLNDYGELVELYRFKAEASSHMVKDDAGEFVKDDDGKFIVESTVLEPNPKFVSAIRNLQGVDIGSAITQKIATIRIKSSEAQDISLIIDPSGKLKELLKNLYVDTIYSIELVIKYKDKGTPQATFHKMVKALNKADNTRRNIRAKLETILDN